MGRGFWLHSSQPALLYYRDFLFGGTRHESMQVDRPWRCVSLEANGISFRVRSPFSSCTTGTRPRNTCVNRRGPNNSLCSKFLVFKSLTPFSPLWPQGQISDSSMDTNMVCTATWQIEHVSASLNPLVSTTRSVLLLQLDTFPFRSPVHL